MAVMKIMIVDRDRDTTDMIQAIRDDLGLVQIEFEASKTKATERIQQEKFNAVFIDPAPNVEDLRAFIIGVRRKNPHYVSAISMSRQMTEEESRACGTNGFLKKPFSEDMFKDQLRRVKNLHELIHRLKDDSQDDISRDGVISKLAFYQIFVSALDRADRYSEDTYLIFVRVDNIHDLEKVYNRDAVEDMMDLLKAYTVKIRRVSDIIGRTAQSELCLLITRPMNKSEPMMAVERFASSMMDYAKGFKATESAAKISVHMMNLPSGEILFSKNCYSD